MEYLAAGIKLKGLREKLANAQGEAGETQARHRKMGETAEPSGASSC